MKLYRSPCTGQFNQVIKKDVLTMKGIKGKVQANRDRALKPGPLTAAAHFNRGLAHGLKGQYAKAIAAFTRAIKLDPKDAAAYSNRGAAY